MGSPFYESHINFSVDNGPLVGQGLGGGVAQGDETGPAGTVLSVEIRTTSSDFFVQAHGMLVVQQSIDDMSVEYRWGGTSCGSKILTESQLSYLMDLAAAPYMMIEPIYKDGQGQTICLVGFKAFNTKYE